LRENSQLLETARESRENNYDFGGEAARILLKV
jgi:hypothetical protein